MFHDLTTDVLGVSLGALDARQKVISNNLANVNTPGFKRSQMEFDDELAKAIGAAEERGASALDDFAAVKTVDGSSSMRTDGNNVDVDVEMARLAENQVRYNTLVEIMAKRVSMMRLVARDGR